MKDDQTGQEFHFFYDDCVKNSKENPDGIVELPAIWPDIKPLQGRFKAFSFYVSNIVFSHCRDLQVGK